MPVGPAGEKMTDRPSNGTHHTFSPPRTVDYNVIVIGAGAAGLVSAYIAAAVKARVALIEKDRMGGECLHTGCVPSKALIRTAKVLSYAHRAGDFGLHRVEVDFDFAAVMERVQRVIGRIEPHDSAQRYSQLGVDCIHGEAHVRSPYSVTVNGRTLTTRNIIIATGARPAVPDLPGVERVGYLTSDTVWSLRRLPRRLLVLGGGPVGCELAQAFGRLGSQVTLVEGAGRLLNREDPEVGAFIAARLREEGMNVLVDHRPRRFDQDGADKSLLCDHGGGEVKLPFDDVLLALGRSANVRGFGLEDLGVTLAADGSIAADGFLRTNFANIYVCGDVTGPYRFTHVGAHQAWYAAVNALFSPVWKSAVDYRVIPWCTYTDPEVARVGLNEQEARAGGVPYELTTYDVGELDRAITEEEDRGFIRVLTPPGRDKVLGATCVTARAGDTIAEFVLAMKHGLGLNKLLGTIHVYPTFAEANKHAAGQWKIAHAPRMLLRWLARYHRWRRG
jgi:pyruvate/2-oxoglutarate dehydrogenase complex dihydrolipoamide dehydrogenase (E3) component